MGTRNVIDDPIGLDAVIHRKGKPFHLAVPDRLVDWGVGFRSLRDLVDSQLSCRQECFAQTFPLLFVPVIGFVNIVPDARLKDDRKAHRLRLTWAVISSQVNTFFGSASSAAKR
jgi:hypothetical protein